MLRARRTIIVSVMMFVLPACSTASAPKPAPSAATEHLYVSIGDSYAAGYQPTARREGSMTRNGFAYQVVTLAKAKGYHLSLTNFGCGGATTASVLHAPGCKAKYLGPGAASYDPKTQAAAAEEYLRAHRGHVDLITVSLGGNDLTSCVDTANPVGCLTSALAAVKQNLHILLADVRAAAGPTTRIVGITYPDVFLGDELSDDAAAKDLADLSVVGFKSLINPALKAEFEAVGGRFVDVTSAAGAYGAMTRTTTLPPYGTIPVPVARICELTYYCQFQDIHPRTIGYTLIAKLIVATLPRG